jgi:hypothetical protein
MQLGKSLVGALVGGAIGIGVLVALYMLTGWDKAWLAIPVAITTGLGVRSAATTGGHASYARGALTAVVAILAFLAFYPVVAKVAVRGAIAQPIVADPLAAQTTEANTAQTDAAEAAAVEPRQVEERPVPDVGAVPRPRNQQFSTWDFLWLSIAGLIAYELGRGTAAAPASGAAGSPDDGPPPVNVGPSAAPPE